MDPVPLLYYNFAKKILKFGRSLKSGLTFSKISEIQNQCKKVMKYYGYRSFDDIYKMRLDPVIAEIPINEDLI